MRYSLQLLFGADMGIGDDWRWWKDCDNEDEAVCDQEYWEYTAGHACRVVKRTRWSETHAQPTPGSREVILDQRLRLSRMTIEGLAIENQKLKLEILNLNARLSIAGISND